MDRTKGRVASVTGGANGIGHATCMLLAKEGGAHVAVTDVLDKQWQDTVRAITNARGTAQFWHLDASTKQEVEDVFAAVISRFGKIDILVNNAGIAGVDKPTHEVTQKDWDRVIGANVKGPFLCTKHAVPYMLKSGGGSIINLSSIYGLVGAPDLPAYHASKGALRMMTKTDALFYAKNGIRVNSVHPGFIWTLLVEELAQRSTQGVKPYRKHLDALHPIGHVGPPEDIAYGILYPASDESKSVTGSELVSFFGNMISSSPLLKVAFTLSGSTSSGRSMVRNTWSERSE